MLNIFIIDLDRAVCKITLFAVSHNIFLLFYKR